MRSLSVVLLAVLVLIAPNARAQTKLPEENGSINITRVFLERARDVGRKKGSAVAVPNDGYEAVKGMVWTEPLPGETIPATQDRLFQIANLAQGFTELERNPELMGLTIGYKLEMGKKADGEDGYVVVRFEHPLKDQLPPGSPTAREWRLLWIEIPATNGTQGKRWLLRRVTMKEIRN